MAAEHTLRSPCTLASRTLSATAAGLWCSNLCMAAAARAVAWMVARAASQVVPVATAVMVALKVLHCGQAETRTRQCPRPRSHPRNSVGGCSSCTDTTGPAPRDSSPSALCRRRVRSSPCHPHIQRPPHKHVRCPPNAQNCPQGSARPVQGPGRPARQPTPARCAAASWSTAGRCDNRMQ